MKDYETDLIPFNNIVALVSSYDKAIELSTVSIKYANETDKLLENTLGQHRTYFHSNFTNYGVPKLKDVKADIKSKFWNLICEKTVFQMTLTPKKKEEIHKDIREDKTPEFTADNINNFIQDTLKSAGSLFDDYIKMVENILRPYGYSNLKTNLKTDKGMQEKVILHGYIDNNYCFSLRYDRHDDLRALWNVMRHFDNKPKDEYSDDLVAIISDNLRNKNIREFNTEYFQVKCFKNGNIHLKNNRLDLVNKFNKYCGYNNLTK